MISSSDARSESRHGVFLETSAHIARVLGSSEMRRGIHVVIRAHEAFATSRFVVDEFQAVVGRLYDVVIEGLRQLHPQSRPRQVDDIWAEILEGLPAFVPGGGKLLSALGTALAARFKGEPVSPTAAVNFLDGQRHLVSEALFVIEGRDLRDLDAIIDNSSCCQWGGDLPDRSKAAPCDTCKLRVLCIDQQEQFIASAATLAQANREESKSLRRLLSEVLTDAPFDLLGTVTKNPGPFGDVIILWDVPHSWSILTRDRTFVILREKHRPDVNVIMVRLPRIISGLSCLVSTPIRISSTVEGILANYTSIDACIVAATRLGRKRGRFVLTVPGLGWANRTGRFERVQNVNGTFQHGIRWVKTPSKPRNEQNDSMKQGGLPNE